MQILKAQPIGNDGNRNQNGRDNLHMAWGQWKTELNGECNDCDSCGGDGGDHYDGGERLAELFVSIASS